VISMVDLTRDENGELHARLLDVVPGRSGTAYAGWLREQSEEFIAGIEHAALDPFRATPTPSATSSRTRSRCWTRSTSCAWAQRSSTTSAAAFSRTGLGTEATRTTRSNGSAACFAAAPSTCRAASSTSSTLA
jgi:hypothetical protein